jgi:hypothetical protein
MWFNIYVKTINPERSMVAARKPWDAPGLKQYQWETTRKVSSQKSRTFHGSRPQTMGRTWPQTASKI